MCWLTSCDRWSQPDVCIACQHKAKETVESLPKVLKKEIKKDEADKLKEVLEAAGAKVELS